MREALEPRTFEHEPDHDAILARGQFIGHISGDGDSEESPIALGQNARATNAPVTRWCGASRAGVAECG
jgi:hypothetical protein